MRRFIVWRFCTLQLHADRPLRAQVHPSLPSQLGCEMDLSTDVPAKKNKKQLREEQESLRR